MTRMSDSHQSRENPFGFEFSASRPSTVQPSPTVTPNQIGADYPLQIDRDNGAGEPAELQEQDTTAQQRQNNQETSSQAAYRETDKFLDNLWCHLDENQRKSSKSFLNNKSKKS